jgi:hypothetical protein
VLQVQYAIRNQASFIERDLRDWPVPYGYVMLPEARMRLAQSWIAVALVLLCGGTRVLAAAQDTSPSLKVEEDKMRFHLLPQSGLELPIRNTSAQQVSGKFTLELLNLEDDSVAATLSGTFTEQPGETIEKIAWPVEQLPSDTPSELGWYTGCDRDGSARNRDRSAGPNHPGWIRNQHGRGAKRGSRHQVSGASPCGKSQDEASVRKYSGRTIDRHRQ